MIIDFVLSGLALAISLLNLIIYRKKYNLIKMIIGVSVAVIFLLFYFIDVLKSYVYIYEIVCALYLIYALLTFIPKKITKNITEYDYFELENNYNDLREDRELLRERFLSTIDLIDEGVVFYENGIKNVILSEYSSKVFGGKSNSTFNEHLERIYKPDRDTLEKAIDRAIKKDNKYEVKYRLESDNSIWVIEKGIYIKAKDKDSIISTIRPISISKFKKSTYFDIDALPLDSVLYKTIKDNVLIHKPFVLIQFELSNLPEINDKYSRDIGSLMMNDYIRFFKNHYLNDVTNLYRLTGSRFVGIIDDLKCYEDFHEDLINSKSVLYNAKLSVSNIKDNLIVNFSVINVKKDTQVSSLDLMKLSTKLLIESKESRRRNYTILNN